MSKARTYICPGCKGKVSIPKGRRLLLETVQQQHQQTCPSRRAKHE